jgi:hypothetical protein
LTPRWNSWYFLLIFFSFSKFNGSLLSGTRG